MNTYRALTQAAVALFADGVFEHEFTVAEEKDWIDRGLIEIVPRPYKVLSANYVDGGEGEVRELALLRENEQALIDGGHLERIDDKRKKGKR
jgi:hypothetical protein